MSAYAAPPPAPAAAPHVAEPPPPWSFAPQGPVLVDSGPLLALFNAGDDWHARVLAWLQQHPGMALVSTWPVLTEVCALLARRVHNQAALDFLLWAERLGLRHILSVDADFDVYRDARGRPLTNLLRA